MSDLVGFLRATAHWFRWRNLDDCKGCDAALTNHVRDYHHSRGEHALRIDRKAPEERRLAEVLAPVIRATLDGLAAAEKEMPPRPRRSTPAEEAERDRTWAAARDAVFAEVAGRDDLAAAFAEAHDAWLVAMRAYTTERVRIEKSFVGHHTPFDSDWRGM